jgi:purine-binding chemotaxis protein CheW
MRKAKKKKETMQEKEQISVRAEQPVKEAEKTAEPQSLEERLKGQGPFEGSSALLDFADALGEEGEERAEKERDTLIQLVTFNLDREEFGIAIRQVREIVRVTEITRVPQSPEHVRGVTNLRGKIVPVVDLKSRIGLAEGKISKESRILVVEGRKRAIGLLVDSVSQVTRIAMSTIEATPQEVRTVKTDYIQGVAKLEERLVILLDVEKILVLK